MQLISRQNLSGLLSQVTRGNLFLTQVHFPIISSGLFSSIIVIDICILGCSYLIPFLFGQQQPDFYLEL